MRMSITYNAEYITFYAKKYEIKSNRTNAQNVIYIAHNSIAFCDCIGYNVNNRNVLSILLKVYMLSERENDEY